MAVTLRPYRQTGTIHRLVFAVVAEADGTVPGFRLPAIEGSLLALSTTPGQPAPSGFGFDVLLLQDGYDVFEGCGLARSGDRPLRTILKFPDSNPSVHQCVALSDSLILHVRGNTVSGARLQVGLYLGVPWGRGGAEYWLGRSSRHTAA